MTRKIDAPEAEKQLIASRIQQVLAHASLSQKDLAEKLGMSPSYVSEIARGLKRPGTDFFIGLLREVGASVDWLLTGEGSMFGGVGIRQDLLRAIRLQIAVARSAILEKDATAQELLALIADDRLEAAGSDARFRKLLDRIAPGDPDEDLAITLYNGHLWASDPISQRRNILASAVAHFENQTRSDKLSALRGRGPHRGADVRATRHP